MKQSTFSAVMANKISKVLQGYTKGIRFLLVMFLILTVSAEVWAQYTKASSIAVGDVVVLVYESGKMELSGISTTSTKYGIGTAYNTTPAGAYALTVEAGSTSGTFSFKCPNGQYLYWTSGNSLATNATKSANTSWKVTFSNGTPTIVNAKDNSRKLQWNTGSPRFACYTTNQTAVQLYKKASTCTVTYDKNGATSGSVPTDDTEYNSGATVTVKQNSGNLAKTGHTFGGWNTKADGTGTNYTAGSGTFNITENTTLYAKWTVKTYTVTWIVNGEKYRTNEDIPYNTSVTAPDVDKIPCGDVIAGWTDAENGEYIHGTSKLYEGAKANISPITSDKTFHAVFADYKDE